MHGADFFNHPDHFATYMQHRQWAGNPNDTLEKPVLLELLPDVQGLDILDLGCGDAGFGLELLDQGCASYTGLEAAPAMVAAARQQVGRRATIIETTLESWTYPRQSYDLVVSRLTLHYIEDLPRLFAQVHHTLKPNGMLVFSVLHPVITASNQSGGGVRQDWVVDDYFVPGARTVHWLGGQVTQYHRPLEDFFGMLVSAGFRVTALRESRPDPANFLNDPDLLRRRQRIPLFLLMAGQRL